MAVTDVVDEIPNWMRRTKCVICQRIFPAVRYDAKYCSAACTQKAYRRRQSEKRHNEAVARRKQDEGKHLHEWVKVLVQAGCTRRQAERTYQALVALGRLDGLPWEQPRMF